MDEIGGLLAKNGLSCVSIIPDHFSQKRWGKGAFTAKDPAIRDPGLRGDLRGRRNGAALSARSSISGRARTDTTIPSRSDYVAERRYTIDAVARLAKAYPDIRFSLEYKPKEPRTHSTWARAADTLLVAKETGRRTSA